MTNQSWHATQYSEHASFVADLGSSVVTLLNPLPGECILDLGCGDGTLTEKLKKLGASVFGIDSSQSMIDAAKEKGLDGSVMNGEHLAFHEEFDAVFSNAALHWMTDYQSVVKGVYEALKPNGRFVGEFGGHGNIQCIINAMREIFTENPRFGEFSIPWYFPTDREYANVLTANGFRINSIGLIPRPTPLKSGVREWLKIFANYLISELDNDEAEDFLVSVEDRVKANLFSESHGWTADYVRLRFSASKA